MKFRLVFCFQGGGGWHFGDITESMGRRGIKRREEIVDGRHGMLVGSGVFGLGEGLEDLTRISSSCVYSGALRFGQDDEGKQ
jgi:hypothetical protein